MKRLIEHFSLCISFFTRIPLPKFLSDTLSDESSLSDAVTFFPVAGLAIGSLTAFIWYLTSLALPLYIAAGLAIASSILITGALHEDGLADCADGFGATRDKEKALEIMRDSQIGTFGGSALIFSIGLRWAALASLTPLLGIAALMISHCASRASLPIAMQYSVYARSHGLGKLASGNLPQMHFTITMITAFAIAFLIGGLHGMVAITLAFALSWSFLKYAEHRIDGYTGDVFGAMQQISEITILIILAGFWS